MTADAALARLVGARLAWLCLFFLLGGGVAGISAAPKLTLSADRVDLPTLGHGGFLFIDARINGKGPFRLLVDTGSSGIGLTAEAAQAAGVQERIGAVMDVTPAGRFSDPLVRVGLIESGGARWENFTAVVWAQWKRTAMEAVGGDRWDGILGMSAFPGLALELDFPSQQVRLSRSRIAYITGEEVSCDYHQVCPRVVIDVEGRRVPALIDSGSGFNLILPNLEAYRLTKAPVLDAGSGGTALGTIVPDRRKNAQLLGVARLGPVIWRNPPVREQLSGEAANIGVGLLSTWRVVFDPPHHRILFLDGAAEREWPVERLLKAHW